MSFFMYNQNAQQAIARPHLDGEQAPPAHEGFSADDLSTMFKYHQQDSWDVGTNAPSSNFIYDFDVYRYWVHDVWQEVLSHTDDGTVVSGSVDALVEALKSGREFKVGIRGICADLVEDPTCAMTHELFVEAGSCYYCTERKLFLTGTHPVVRVRPSIPLRYESKGWDFGWLMPRTDGYVACLLCDPHTLQFHRTEGQYDIRWFVR